MQKQLAIKIGIIVFITLALLIPLNIISSKVYERKNFQYEAENSIAKSWTSAQEVMTPLLVVPYEVETTVGRGPLPAEIIAVEKKVFIPLDEANIVTDVRTSLRKKGIYSVPVYNATIAINGKLSQSTIRNILQAAENTSGFTHFTAAYIAIPIADGRGIAGAPTLKIGDNKIAFKPGAGIGKLSSGLHAPVNIEDNLGEINIAFQLRGMSSLQFIPAAVQTNLTLHSDWPHPKFVGAFLPSRSSITELGFSAEWQINEFSNNIWKNLERCSEGYCDSLSEYTLGTNFYQAVDIYLQTERAIKYGILFIAITFATFFLFEILRRSPIHPIQYTFVGLALAIFYLLLVSLSEHTDFGLAYFISTLSCLLLLNFYLQKVLRGSFASTIFCASLGGLYGLLYVIIQMEDFALLTGSSMLFVILAMIMMATRKINWYQMTKTA